VGLGLTLGACRLDLDLDGDRPPGGAGFGGAGPPSAGGSGGEAPSIEGLTGDAQGCQPTVDTEGKLGWSQDRRLAVGQYLAAVLPIAELPDPSLLEPARLEPYLDDLGFGRPSEAHVTSLDGRHDLHVTANAPSFDGSKVHLVALVDVSSSNGRTESIRNGVLNALADGVDAHASALSVVAFASSADVLLEAVPAGEARLRLEGARASLSTSEGHALAEALKVAGALPRREGEFRHYLLLTDAGFVADEGTLTQVGEMAAQSGALSVAQLAVVEPGNPPELRQQLLDSLAEAGRGATFFFSRSEPVSGVDPGPLCEVCTNPELDASFARWFAVPTLFDPATVKIPGGLAIAEPGGADGGGASTLKSPGFSVRAHLDVTVPCFQEGSQLELRWPTPEIVTPFPLAFDGEVLSVVGSEVRPAAEEQLAKLAAIVRSAAPECVDLQELAAVAHLDACNEDSPDSRACHFGAGVLQLIDGAAASYCP
jgi:hypothetical protein